MDASTRERQPVGAQPLPDWSTLGPGFDAFNGADFTDDLSQVDLLQRLLSEPVAQMGLLDFEFATL